MRAILVKPLNHFATCVFSLNKIELCVKMLLLKDAPNKISVKKMIVFIKRTR